MTQPPDTDTHVYFYGPEFYCLSNFSAFQIVWKGKLFPTAEHAYHWEKFIPSTPTHFKDMVQFATSAHEAYRLGQSLLYRRKDWDDVKLDIMECICRVKMNQHHYVYKKLRETGGRILVEDSWRDDYWGWGPNQQGANHLGRIWMKIREEIK